MGKTKTKTSTSAASKRGRRSKKDTKVAADNKITTRRKIDPDDRQYRPDTYTTIPSKPKQTNAPKRPLSAYFLFAQQNRPKYQKENPNLKMTDLTKLMAEEWQTKLTTAQKKKYNDEAEILKAEYKEEREKYVKSAAYRKWKKKNQEWNEYYKEEFNEQQRKKKEDREEQKKKREENKAKRERAKAEKENDKGTKKKGK